MDSVSCIPGGPRDQATSVFIDGDLYVFGGIGKNSKGLTQVFNDVHKYNPKTNSWVKLMSHAPMGMAGHVTLYTTAKLMLLAVLTRISSMAILKISTRLERFNRYR